MGSALFIVKQEVPRLLGDACVMSHRAPPLPLARCTSAWARRQASRGTTEANLPESGTPSQLPAALRCSPAEQGYRRKCCQTWSQKRPDALYGPPRAPSSPTSAPHRATLADARLTCRRPALLEREAEKLRSFRQFRCLLLGCNLGKWQDSLASKQHLLLPTDHPHPRSATKVSFRSKADDENSVFSAASARENGRWRLLV